MLHALALAAVLLAVLAAAASAEVVYNRAGDCINASPVGASVIATTADGSLQILAEPADRGLATNLLSGLQSGPLAGLHNAFSADGRSGRLPARPDGGPYQLMVATASDFDADNDGDTAGDCDGSALSAIALRDDVSDPLTVATHELGHAFTDGLLGQQSHDTWFEEALSEYHAFVLAPNATLQRNRNDQRRGRSQATAASATSGSLAALGPGLSPDPPPNAFRGFGLVGRAAGARLNHPTLTATM